MLNSERASSTTVPTQFVTGGAGIQYAYRRFGSGSGLPLLFLQHFTGTMDNWDPAVTDALAASRPVILFDSAGIGRSTGQTPDTVADMATHAIAFADALGLKKVDLLGFSLGGMVAQQMALDRPTLMRRIVLAGTGPEGGENMDMLKPELLEIFNDQKATVGERLLRLFFSPTETSQAAGRQFFQRLGQRTKDREPESGTQIFQAQAAAITEWGKPHGERFARLAEIKHPVFVFNGNKDIMIPTVNSFVLSQHLPNAALIVYPDSGHGALFQYAAPFTRHVTAFLDSDSEVVAI